MRGAALVTSAILLTACANQAASVLPPELKRAGEPVYVDFAVWIEGRRVDFSDRELQSPDKLVDLENGGRILKLDRPGVTLGEVFDAFGATVTLTCLITEAGNEYCSENGKRWRFFVNGKERPLDPDFLFQSTDRALLTYDATTYQAQEQFAQVTDDACIYANTCPERGRKPQNCGPDDESCTVVDF